jgi:D-alanyl-D-alanine carboxypeptidase/D-alanyl-D-alanine-endopeptidase (penicillin-binding protein 4)
MGSLKWYYIITDKIYSMKTVSRIYSLIFVVFSLFFISCSVQNRVSKDAKHFIFDDSNFAPAHIGISVYNTVSKKYLYNYQGNKYFVPASNAKLLTCYAALKYLGDSLIAFRYIEMDSLVYIIPAGDPTFLHKDFISDKVFNFLKEEKLPLKFNLHNWEEKPLGVGWAWDDYNDDYMAERSPFPVYGNIIDWSLDYTQNSQGKDSSRMLLITPNIGHFNIQNSTINKIVRDKDRNNFSIYSIKKGKYSYSVPFVTNGFEAAKLILQDTLKREISISTNPIPTRIVKVIHSQSTDSLLKIMMHRSDNFFAEQSLLMVSNECLGVMNDAKIIDLLLKTDYKNLPQKPKWVDGCGLSRYNLISPQDFVAVLEKMKNEFAWSRISTILPTGNTGTLSGYYQKYSGKIYAKTGTLSNNVSISGYITTKKGNQLIFSVLVNNHQTSATNIRRSVEKFISSLIEKY